MAHEDKHPATPAPDKDRKKDPPAAIPTPGTALHIDHPGAPMTPVSTEDLRRDQAAAQPSVPEPATPSKPWPKPIDPIPGPGTKSGPAPADKSAHSDWNPAGAPKYAVGDRAMYMRQDGSSSHAIPATVAEVGIDPTTGLQGVRLSVAASPGRSAFDIWASYSESKESGTWHRV